MRNASRPRAIFACFGFLLAAAIATAQESHPLGTWVKRHPPEKTTGKPPPKMGYETSYGYDPFRRLLIRYAGHNQGGGGEQNSEVWTYDLDADVWTLREPNDAPPGVCCGQQNVFDEALRKFVRFPSFSGSHGWQSPREISLKDSSVWTYDLDTNTWRAMRPCPEVWPKPLRGAAWDPHHQVTVLHAGETAGHGTAVYDLYANTWHELKPRPAPESNNSQPGFTYDAVHRLFVLFGSQFHSDPRTWVYDLRKNAWRVLEVAEHPPADKSCPVLAADTRNGVVLCSVIGASGLETWALDVTKLHGNILRLQAGHGSGLETWALEVTKPQWTRLNGPQPDPSGGRNRVLVYLPDRNLFVLENRTKDEQQIWTFRYAEARPAPSRIENLRVTTQADSATLAWTQLKDSQLSYTIYRGQGDKPWTTELQPIARDIRGTSYTDNGLRPGTVYFYQVRAEGPGKYATSWLARTQPPVVTEVVVSSLGPKRVEIEWTPHAEDAAGYHVERADVAVYSSLQVRRIRERCHEASDTAVGRIKAIGPFHRLTKEPLTATRFVDQTADLAGPPREPADPLANTPLQPDQFDADGKPYRYAVHAYRVRAVNRLGVESGPSPVTYSFPSAVEQVFSKEEDGGKTRLKWQANREKSIRGYHVYRHDGRYDKEPIVRLTSEPITSSEFLDDRAGKSTRRYEVVAVDALGQEGAPSQPVWSRREWGRYYIPYTGPWHQ